MDTYKARLKARRQQLPWKERYLSHEENPLLFILFSWKFHYYNKVFKYFVATFIQFVTRRK